MTVDIINALDVTINQNKIEDENNVTNSFLVNSHLPFPVSGEYFNPSYIIEPQKEFEFELVKYLETKSNKPPIPIPVPVPVENNNDDDTEDSPISEMGTIELTFPDYVIPDDTNQNDMSPNDVILDDVIPDDIPQDNEISEDVIPNEILDNNPIPNDTVSSDNIQATPNDTLTIPVIVILTIVLSAAGFLIWKRPSFVWKNKNKKKQNITKTKISFDDKISLEIETIPDENNLLLSKSGLY